MSLGVQSVQTTSRGRWHSCLPVAPDGGLKEELEL